MGTYFGLRSSLTRVVRGTQHLLEAWRGSDLVATFTFATFRSETALRTLSGAINLSHLTTSIVQLFNQNVCAAFLVC
jgi:hypothetical protein